MKPPILLPCLLCAGLALADHQGRDWKAEYRDGPCKIKEEGKPGGYKIEIKCEGGVGALWQGEWKEEFRHGHCAVKREAKFDEYKEEVQCGD